jgi:hypothetical protein
MGGPCAVCAAKGNAKLLPARLLCLTCIIYYRRLLEVESSIRFYYNPDNWFLGVPRRVTLSYDPQTHHFTTTTIQEDDTCVPPAQSLGGSQ